MSQLCEEYILSHNVEEAVNSLSASKGSARLLGGGSDLLLELQQGIQEPVKVLVDITRVEEMCALEARDHTLYIGAAVTLARLAESQLVKQHAEALADAAKLMANPQVCNVATIGGNVAHALPAADGSIALLALDAQAEIASPNGRRREPLQALFQGPGQSTLNPCRDVLVGFYLPLSTRGEASTFTRRVNPQGIALALLNVAIWLQRDGEHIADIHIAVGPSGPVPRRMSLAERILLGYAPSPERRALAIQAVLEEGSFRTSPHRASAVYRRHLVQVLLDEALATAWKRAGG
jgi:CO/xanthine dehydrogenase FAD-binding subunit